MGQPSRVFPGTAGDGSPTPRPTPPLPWPACLGWPLRGGPRRPRRPVPPLPRPRPAGRMGAWAQASAARPVPPPARGQGERVTFAHQVTVLLRLTPPGPARPPANHHAWPGPPGPHSLPLLLLRCCFAARAGGSAGSTLTSQTTCCADGVAANGQRAQAGPWVGHGLGRGPGEPLASRTGLVLESCDRMDASVPLRRPLLLRRARPRPRPRRRAARRLAPPPPPPPWRRCEPHRGRITLWPRRPERLRSAG